MENIKKLRMNGLSRKNLQEFCRTCLSALETSSSTGIGGKKGLKGDLALMPQLRTFLHILTSSDDEHDEYPQRLCKLCFAKLQDFQRFRRTILKSAQKIEHILKEPASIENLVNATPKNPKDNVDDGINYDSKLLLPELAAEWNSNIIKTEPEVVLENECPIEQINTVDCSDIQVKNEIDSEYEQDDNSCQFYEQNALSTVQTTLNGNGDAQEDNELLYSSKYPTYKKDGTLKASRKRDRNKKSLKCPRCDKQVYKKVYLDAHIRGIHEGHDKPFLCNECQKSFTRYNQLHVHMQTSHTVEVKLVCGISGCSATFKMKNTLETHRRAAHAEQSTNPLELEQIIAMHQKQLVKEWDLDHFCKQCGKKYSSKRALSEHLKRHLQIKHHVCKVCGAAKVTRTELLTHMRTHESNLEKFKCTLCPQEFNHKNAISRHIRVVHEGERRFICRFCPRRFGTRHAQISHERLHTGERPFKCELCAKGFAQVEGLKSHMKNHDKSLRKHVCKFCSQRFITRKNLTDHEQRHLGNKPHICVVCSRGFFKREDLDLHSKLHEEEIKCNNGQQIKTRIYPSVESNNEVSTEEENIQDDSNDAYQLSQNHMKTIEEDSDETGS